MFLLMGRVHLIELIMVSVLVASLCSVNIATFCLLAAHEYRIVAWLRIINALVTGLGQVIGGVIHPNIWMLLSTYALGNAVATLLALPSLLRLRRIRGVERFTLVAREEHLARFAASVGTGAALSNLGIALPLVGVSVLYGEAAAGSFYLARRLLMVPTQLVAASVSEVSYAMVARQGVERISAQVDSWLRRFRVVAVVVLALGLAMAPITPVIVGSGYPDVGWIVVLLTLPAVAQMVATSFSNILLALHMEVIRTLWNVGRLAGLVPIYGWALMSGAELLQVVAVFAVYTVLTYAILLGVTLRGLRWRRATA
jgi:hypothetical protein